MFTLMSKLAGTILMSAATLTNPTNPKALPFDASAYVTVNNQVRVSVSKTAETSVVVLLRNSDNWVVFRQNIGKHDMKAALKLNVDELADGTYELEVHSSEGSIRKQLNLSTPPAQPVTPGRLVAVQ